MQHPQSDRLVLADSFLVDLRDGVPVAHGLDLHQARFREDLKQLGYAEDATAFWEEGIRRICAFALAEGPSFPRFECWASASGLRLHLSLRHAPARTDSISMAVAESPVDSSAAKLKGPNIARYAELIREHGSEVLLTNPDGIALEGTTTSLMWWEHNTLMTVSPEHARVTSVTEALVLEIARELRIPTGFASRSPEELCTCELWAVNSLHGIRPVTQKDSDRLRQFRAQYAARARPL